VKWSPASDSVELSVVKSYARAAVTSGPKCGKLKTLSLGRSCCQKTASGDCDGLRTLCMCVSDL
jgi:hypothetical protein